MDLLALSAIKELGWILDPTVWLQAVSDGYWSRKFLAQVQILETLVMDSFQVWAPKHEGESLGRFSD